ncbi:secondary thiamine-phosphate synthase enzyme [Candidatus Roizmanbacteria bacterium CG17_big_fil_post_rev_8_21_14_2_50_39_7]|uniref:Secondary thiamine-phosphate synthase enzyme n=1 Tax=Candidatus Roizmanbacteria bacterium CG17_big_fil_post_rev_8_21_14_2_50_39_7 TaxID=1974858 RepID=A0A2M7EKV9_9BACT|nr:MAG: secondary thiamine-phosphate synthase enzyme [Candidatus Roizmanbacteria bacterium CG17_big_fil_post_rev_8_21_14_2_50_39_7]
MKHHVKKIKYQTKKFMDFIDITEDVALFAKENKIQNGFLTIFINHTTAAIRINEREKGITKDFELFAKKLLPSKDYYHHNDLTIRTENLVCEPGASDCLNGHSHNLHLLMGGTSEHVPIIDGKLAFGTFQRIFLIELDCARPRSVTIQIIGE